MLHGLVCLPGLKTRGRMDFKWPSHCSQVKIEAGVGTRDYLLTSLVINTQGQPKHCWINNKCPSSTMRVSTAVEDGFKMCVGKQGQGCNLWLLSLPLPLMNLWVVISIIYIFKLLVLTNELLKLKYTMMLRREKQQILHFSSITPANVDIFA